MITSQLPKKIFMTLSSLIKTILVSSNNIKRYSAKKANFISINDSISYVKTSVYALLITACINMGMNTLIINKASAAEHVIETAKSIDASDSDDLQTITTPHARIHFSKGYQVIADEIASKFEAIYAAVSKRVGFEQNEILDFLISDDIHQSNGSALLLTAGKLIRISTSAPRSNEVLGFYDDWLEVVISHELTHKVHISEPTRRWQASLERYLLNADMKNQNRYPRWLSEGYATVVETQYTGKGRVNSDYVNALLTQWALEGQLPSYYELNGYGGYLGFGMAYLQGSDFLTWLEKKYASHASVEDSLFTDIWRRSTAKYPRSFEQAFYSIFLNSPQNLYKVFVVEQTYLAKQAQQAWQKSALLTAELARMNANDRSFTKQEPQHRATPKVWQNNNQEVLSFSPSSDGTKILQLIKNSQGRRSLQLIEIADNTVAKAAFKQGNAYLLREDPRDVADHTPDIFLHKLLAVVHPSPVFQWQQSRYLDDSHALVLQYQRQSNDELGF